MKNKKGQMNISFGWLFAIIVGAVIIFLAILGATKVIKIGQQEGQAVGAKELGILLNPLEIGFGSAISTPLLLRVETRIFNKCSVSGNFGKQGIQTSEFSFNKWTIPGVESSFENKKYCFDNAPENIAEEILQLNQGNLAANCSKVDDKTIKVCFNKNCGINVNYNSKYVQKGEDKSYFEEDALMYAAIFSDKEIYECQVKRLMKRTKQLAELYKEKELLVSQKNCAGELAVDLDLLMGNLENAKDYKIINDVY